MSVSQFTALMREAVMPVQDTSVDNTRHVQVLEGVMECPCCGLTQKLPELKPGTQARCSRCSQLLDRRNKTAPIATPLAFCVTSAALYVAMLFSTLMMLDLYGRQRTVDIITGPIELLHEGWGEVGILVAIATVLAPGIVIAMMGMILTASLRPNLPAWVPHLMKWYEVLRPWSMVEVYILGVFVAYTKLVDLAFVEVGAAVYLVAGLMVSMAATDATLDTEIIWRHRKIDTFMRPMSGPRLPLTFVAVDAQDPLTPSANRVSCLSCGLVLEFDHPIKPTEPSGYCPRCGHVVRHRKANSMSRSVALLVSAIVFYLPANIYPVMTVIRMGAGTGHTIVEGAIELWVDGMIPLSLLVIFASVTVPVLKVIGLSYMVETTRHKSHRHLRFKSKVYRVIDIIGRWSMIDVFMVSILVAMVRFNHMASITANGGMVCFAAVVVLTIFAVHTFDPRLMWDAAGKNGDAALARTGGRRRKRGQTATQTSGYQDNMEPDRA
ncbi:paraquat-inducible protein A [Acetobacter orleanensis]|uniref:Paraquat-inducible membrane protein A n=1 Tax=Acetobacter orleanensis TaxID=104099 RepID=A0A4Y3TRR6_9PROT|nr:paraquat-inducible protein A [Acetobacter orleanensis]KXV62735.1 paraquat-inducible protein A [Acetobacter orleanensis]PCD79255.1 paraquat-inducible protein A [Acetobacter orleanensis]GAN67867.1 paraquat-inducible protein A [Acetobacter orleanensis JCM 7639]GBR23780.1 paraquat-inducible protein A [Acetobacter orleanensis NRIC 0473]GEB83455.1 paraquat-inducible membrane protein A [Acetobacter orleanensis]